MNEILTRKQKIQRIDSIINNLWLDLNLSAGLYFPEQILEQMKTHIHDIVYWEKVKLTENQYLEIDKERKKHGK